jgi:hypothetical protein
MIASHAIHRTLRRTPPARFREACKALETSGFAELVDFADKNTFERLREAAVALANNPAVKRTTHVHGSTHVEYIPMASMDSSVRSIFRSWVEETTPQTLLSWAERRSDPVDADEVAIERVRFGLNEAHDPQNDLHSDVFYPTFKLWYYLHDVEEDGGPLVVVPGSHKVSLRRLRRVYRNSVGAREGSRRIHPDELLELGLTEKAMTCRANTLVIVNTCGYHCRRPGRPDRDRLSLHMNGRANPFLPAGLLRLSKRMGA